MTDRILYKKDTEQGSNELHKPYGTWMQDKVFSLNLVLKYVMSS